MTARRGRRTVPRRQRVPRPERFLPPVLGSALLLAAWGAVAHASGSGWVQAVGAVVAGILLIGLLAPALAAARLRAVCVASPGDATAGSPVAVELYVNHGARCLPVVPAGRAAYGAAGTATTLELEPERRGVVDTCYVKLASASPFGLVWWSRLVPLELTRTLYVAPRTGEPSRLARATAPGDDGHDRARPHPTGELRGVRPYDHGDGRRRIHWRATAHSGELMVRETEQRPDRPVHVLVDLPTDPVVAEVLAEDALATVVAHLAAGDRVVLETTEPSGRVVAPVVDRVSAGRRLARALPVCGATW